MPSRRVDEGIEDFKLRRSEYLRNWRRAKQTTAVDADGNVRGQSITQVAPREPYAPLSDYTLARRSTLVDAEGGVIQTWHIERPEERARHEAWMAVAAALAVELPRLEPIPPRQDYNGDLLVGYPIGDHHMGMLGWKHETGESYDLDISELILKRAVDDLVERSPNAQIGLVGVLGDFFHYDSLEPVTPTSKNLLDADGRYPKMVSAGMRTLRYVIERALEKHEHIHVIVEIGNHDPSSAIFLQLALAAIYENEPRVTIDISPKHFHYFEFGSVLLGTHHGHGRAAKAEQLPLIMAADRPEEWGRTRYRYWWTGHIHNQTVREMPGCTVESFPILPPPDAYAANEGYRAKREMKAIVYHREFGEIGRTIINPAMLKGRA